jgi:transposase
MRVVGIDISKNKIDGYCLPDNQSFQYSLSELATATQAIEALKPDWIILEASGGYERPWVKALQDVNLPVAVEHPLRQSYYRKALGQQTKTDPQDAKALACYGLAHSDKLVNYSPKTKALQSICELVDRRNSLVEQQSAEKNRLQQCKPGSLIQGSIERTLKHLQEEIQTIETSIQTLISEDVELKQKQELLVTVPGVASKTTWSLLAYLPELGKLNRKAIASLAGLAPFQQQSGQWRGKACIRGGRAPVRKALYMATMTAVKYCQPIKDFYQRLVEQGKAKKLALTACMHKLLRILNCILKAEKSFQNSSS